MTEIRNDFCVNNATLITTAALFAPEIRLQSSLHKDPVKHKFYY